MSKLRDIVRTVAPALATALGGPLTGSAVRLLSEKFLGKADGTEEEVAAALSVATPEQIVELKRLDHDFKKHLVDAGIKLEELAMQDRASARTREAAVRDWVPGALGFLIVSGFLAAVWAVISGHAAGLNDSAIVGILGTVIGYLSAKADQVTGYYYGSSAGSKAKTDAMERIRKGGE